MLSQVKKVRTSNVCVVKANPIQVTQRSVDELNRKIEKDIMKNILEKLLKPTNFSFS